MKTRLLTIAILGLALSFLIPDAAIAQERKERTKNRKEFKQKKKKAKKAKKVYKKKRKKERKKIAHLHGKFHYKPIHHDGIYHRYYKKKYTSHIRIGAHYAKLPRYSHKIKYGKKRYYFHNGYFYTPHYNNRYRVVLPPVGLCVSDLPCYDHVYFKHGNKHIVCHDVLYKKYRHHGRVHFKVVGYLRF